LISTEKPLHVVIAGAGVGGLTLANALAEMPHVKTTVLEKTSKFKRFGGPIQLASNAMQVGAFEMAVYSKHVIWGVDWGKGSDIPPSCSV